MATQTDAFARTLIDAQLKDQHGKISDGISVRYEYTLPDGDRADDTLCDRLGRCLAIVEAKREGINAADVREQGRHNAEQANVPFVFLANGNEILFLDWQHEEHPRQVNTFFSQADLERRSALPQLRVDPLTVPIDTRIAGRDYQVECNDTLCREIVFGRCNLLVEMATGTGKTRTANDFGVGLFKPSLDGGLALIAAVEVETSLKFCKLRCEVLKLLLQRPNQIVFLQ